MNALVMGGDGFLGANLCRLLLEHGHEVTATALSRKGHTSLDALGVDCRIEYGDVQDADFVGRVVNATQADWIFHLAAVSIVRVAEGHPGRCFRTNILGTLNVLDACVRAQVQAVVMASSDKAYGDACGIAYREDMPLRPGGAYETSKACADLIGQYYGRNGLRVMVTRCANLYGPGDLNWSRLVPGSCRRAIRKEPPLIHAGAWDYQREWLNVEDAAQAYRILARKGMPGAYNVGSGQVATAGDVATNISVLAQGPEPIEAAKPATFTEIPEQRLDSSKMRGLGWTSGPLDFTATLMWYGEYLTCA